MQKKLLLCLVWFLIPLSVAWAQDRTITGKITDAEAGTGIPGVSVFVKGTTIGTVTDSEGRYSITVSSNSAILVFQAVGLLSQEVPVSGSSVLDISMKPDVVSLGEVVVTGLGEATDKRKIGISVESVNAKDFTNAPTATLDQALQGKVAGALIQSISGQPGQQQNIILRGINALGTNQPMIMIDGVQINTDNNFNGSTNNASSRLADLDLSNIERVEVVQGAAAATIYGAQGANGVIQIFTKKGVAGKPAINFSSTIGFSEVLRGKLKFPDSHFYDTDNEGFIIDTDGNRMGLSSEGFYNEPAGAPTAADRFTDKPFKETLYNPLDQVFKTAVSRNNSLNISGGSEKITYAISASNMNQESVIFGKLNRNSVRLNLGFELFKNFRVNTGTNFVSSNNTSGGITGQDNVSSPLGSALLSRQYIKFDQRDSKGNLIGRLEDDNSVNPLFAFENQLFDADVRRVLQNVNFNYKPHKFVELDYKYGLDTYEYKYQDLIKNQEDYQRAGIAPFAGRIQQRIDKGSTQNSLLTGFFRINLAEDFGSNLPLSFTTQAAFDWRKETYNQVFAQVTGIPAEENINLGRGSDPFIGETDQLFVTYGYLINQRIEYKNLLGISGGFRADRSSAFGRGAKAFVFGRGDIFLRVSQLGFWNSIKSVIPELKLRAAYGAAGIQPGAYDRIPVLKPGTIGNKSFLITPLELQNPDLNVQVSREFEVGSDISFTIGKEKWFSFANLNLTYWNRKSEDVIRLIELPFSAGSATILTNAFELSSRGLQISLDLQVLDTKQFAWNFLTNFGTSINKVDKISNGKDLILGAAGSGGFVLREGARLGVFYGFEPLRNVNQTRGDGSRYIPEANVGQYEIVNGMVVQTANQNVQFTNEKVEIGDPTPDFNMSFINNFRVGKYLNLSFQLDWVQGFQIYNQTKQWMYRDLVHSDATVPVTIGGVSKAYTRFYTSQYLTNQPSASFVEDGSFLRLRDVSISFDISKIVKLNPVKNLNLILSGRNLITWTKYSGIDPEAAANLNDPTQRGLDLYSFPNFRTYNIGLNVGF
jgi:TonB-dependent starch-binding outer membrane protein SusC